MIMTKAILVGALAGAMFATPVMAAADNVCLQHNRMLGWRALDDHTILVTDRSYKRYTVHLQGACTGLTHGGARLVFRTWTNLGCVNGGDLLGVSSPGLGFVNCSIGGVEAGAPGSIPAN